MHNITARKGQLGQGRQKRTARTGQLGRDVKERTTSIGLAGHEWTVKKKSIPLGGFFPEANKKRNLKIKPQRLILRKLVIN
jgi:hypothetical protein